MISVLSSYLTVPLCFSLFRVIVIQIIWSTVMYIFTPKIQSSEQITKRIVSIVKKYNFEIKKVFSKSICFSNWCSSLINWCSRADSLGAQSGQHLYVNSVIISAIHSRMATRHISLPMAIDEVQNATPIDQSNEIEYEEENSTKSLSQQWRDAKQEGCSGICIFFCRLVGSIFHDFR